MAPLVGYLNNALKAKELFKRDRDYIVTDGEVLIVGGDANTGTAALFNPTSATFSSTSGFAGSGEASKEKNRDQAFHRDSVVEGLPD